MMYLLAAESAVLVGNVIRTRDALCTISTYQNAWTTTFEQCEGNI